MRQGMTIMTTLVILISVTLGVIIFSNQPDIEKYRETTIDIRVEVSVRNLGPGPASDIPLRLAIPVNHTPYQSLERMQLSEQFERKTNDSLGNQFLHFSIDNLDPHTQRNFTLNLTLKLNSVDVNIRKQSIRDDKTEGDLSRYLAESSLVNYNEQNIIDLAREIARKSDEIHEIAWNSYEWIIENIFYQQIPGEWDASITLKNGEGGSAELSNLFVALMRANGIAARRISGWANHFEEREELFLSRFSHGWAEFHLPGYGWIPVDPTWGKSHKFDYFGKTDNDHVTVTLGAGIHYMWRGPYSSPFEDTEIDTDYKLVIGDISVKNLSLERDIITAVIFGCPLILVIFIIHKRLKQRQI